MSWPGWNWPGTPDRRGERGQTRELQSSPKWAAGFGTQNVVKGPKTGNADDASFKAAISDLAYFKQHWPEAIEAVITKRLTL